MSNHRLLAKKSLHATRDDALSSASQFTSFGPACLSWTLARFMRSAIPVFLFLLVASCCVSCRSTSDPRATWTSAEGYEYLIVSRRFALGGVGFAGATSTGEFAFRAVLRSRGAREVFKLVLSPGAQATEEGKLYALCGIRATDRAAFDRYAAFVVSTNAEVTTQSGCIVSHERVADVVKQIADGAYDSYCSKQ